MGLRAAPTRAAKAWQSAIDEGIGFLTAIARVFNGYPGTVRGAIWMILGGISLLMLAIVIRHLQQKFHVLEMIFLRSVISFLLILPWALRQQRSELTTQRLPLHIFRNGIHYLGNIGWFVGVTLISLADLQALQFTEPLFAIVLAVIFLREQIGAHRWVATFLGFVGALVIIRPGIVEISPGTMAVLICAVFYASSKIATKALANTDSPNTILLYMTIIFIPLSAAPAFFLRAHAAGCVGLLAAFTGRTPTAWRPSGGGSGKPEEQ